MWRSELKVFDKEEESGVGGGGEQATCTKFFVSGQTIRNKTDQQWPNA